MLLVPCTAFVSSQEISEAPVEATHAPAILVDGLPPLICGDEICERPLREYERDQTLFVQTLAEASPLAALYWPTSAGALEHGNKNPPQQ